MQALFRLCAHLPLPVLHAIGVVMGWLVYCASPTYRRRFHENSMQAGLVWSEVRRAVGEAGKLVFELPWIWLRPHAQKQPRIAWQGADLVAQALARGKGVIFMTPHVGCFEAIPQAQIERFPSSGAMTLLYKPSKSAWFDAILKEVRSAPGLEPAPTTTGGVRMVLKALKQGRVIGLLPDQVPADGLGVWAPFFGKTAYTMTLAVRLAQQTGATLLLTWGDRLQWGQGYVVHVEPLDLPLDQSNEACATALNRAMEGLIARRPGMYLWSYARYKQPRKEV